MKLIGSKTENEIREQLMLSNQALFKEEERRRLRDVLHQNYPRLETAFILHWIPDQGEDFYKILVDGSFIANIELSRVNQDAAPIVKTMSLSHYKVGLSKRNQIKLAVALDLARADINKKRN